ncbi:hypothetical protein DWU98_14420 [Dyella monticola]|uniref:Uncharacterized protein n=1 Tax=Dyella monticola TaxID=1927958 RepID=A0A370WVW7_9GAMM|nr:hypothetical protein [Dyella monticola]RDS80105.1 hypothetical protein DWU98_14420 [Dyella monticola]
MPFHIHVNAAPHIEHVIPTGKESGSRPDGIGHEAKPLMTSSAGFADAQASSKPHGLLGRLPTPSVEARAVTWEGNIYFVKQPSNTSTPQPLYTRDSAGVLKQTPKLGIYDGKDGVKLLDIGLPGGSDKDSLVGGKKSSKSTTPWTMKRLVNKLTRSSSSNTAGYRPIAEKGTPAHDAQMAAARQAAMDDRYMS